MTSTSIKDVPLVPIISKRSFEKISAQIKNLIFEGTLSPGDKLPSEMELARRFNVGRQTVREALRLLEMSGFITIKKGSTGGPIIENTVLNRLSDTLTDAIHVQKISIDELTLTRLEIEKLVLKCVVKNVKETDIGLLRDNIAQAKEKAAVSFELLRDSIVKYNIEFHRLLAKISKNKMYVIIIEAIMAVVSDFLSAIGHDFEAAERVLLEHEAIVEAIENRDLEEALGLLEKHILTVGSGLKGRVGELPD